MTLLERKQRSVNRLTAMFDDWNVDPDGGGWTGYNHLEQLMRSGKPMVSGVCVTPATAYQYAAYDLLQNIAIELGYERRPPAPHGLGCLHLHFERSDHGDIDGGDGEGDGE